MSPAMRWNAPRKTQRIKNEANTPVKSGQQAADEARINGETEAHFKNEHAFKFNADSLWMKILLFLPQTLISFAKNISLALFHAVPGSLSKKHDRIMNRYM